MDTKDSRLVSIMSKEAEDAIVQELANKIREIKGEQLLDQGFVTPDAHILVKMILI